MPRTAGLDQLPVIRLKKKRPWLCQLTRMKSSQQMTLRAGLPVWASVDLLTVQQVSNARVVHLDSELTWPASMFKITTISLCYHVDTVCEATAN